MIVKITFRQALELIMSTQFAHNQARVHRNNDLVYEYDVDMWHSVR